MPATSAIGYADQAGRTGDSPISFFVKKALETPGLISFAAGLVDEASLPAGAVAEATAAVLADPAHARRALQYGSTQGLPQLRRQALERVCRADGIDPAAHHLDADCVVLTTGSQQMLYLLGEVLINPGDIVICEAPSYFVYHDCLKSHGARVMGVPMDADGMRTDLLEELLVRLEASGELPRVKLIYTVDYFQNPTGLTLSVERRRHVYELAKRFSRQHRILVLEDAAYRELRFGGPDLVSIKSFDTTNEHVIYTSTFSKPCAPGLKSGYTLMPRELVRPTCNLKGGHDFGSSNLNQHVIAHMIESGAFDAQVEALRPVYRAKAGAMVAALEVEFADWPEVTFSRPAGGLYVWVTFPPSIDTGSSGQLVGPALEHGVLYVPGEYGHVPDEFGFVPKNEARLSFGVADLDQIPEGVRRLREACRGLEGAEVAPSDGAENLAGAGAKVF